MKDPIRLAIQCRRCGSAVSLSYEPGVNYETQVWICPHISCKAVQPIDLKGTITTVMVRDEPPAA